MRPVVQKVGKEPVVDETEELDDAEEKGDAVEETQVHGETEAAGEKTAKKKAKMAEADGAVKEGMKNPKKAKADAHANYKRLNIKNKNSKANGRGGGRRFGRR